MFCICSVGVSQDTTDPEPRPCKIIHIDMDAFFASVEQRDNPDLRGKPVAVGYGSARGVVAAASYEARKFGVHSAMASVTAKRKCPDLIFVPPRFEAYRAVSTQIRAIFADYTALIEPLSLDEAYLDVTENLKSMASATDIAREIRDRIFVLTGLTASAGVSYNKFLAKMASGQNKPNGEFVITPQHGEGFVASLPVRKFHGIGPATTKRMMALGIETGADLKRYSLQSLTQHFGSAGPFYYRICRGIDHRAVTPDRERKSIGAEDTFLIDIFDPVQAQSEIDTLVQKVWAYADQRGLKARTITVKVKYADFQTITRSRTMSKSIGAVTDMAQLAKALLNDVFPTLKGIRLLGVTLSIFGEGEASGARQLAFDF